MNTTRLFLKRKIDSRDAVEAAIENSKDGWMRTWDAAQRKADKDAHRRQPQKPKKQEP